MRQQQKKKRKNKTNGDAVAANLAMKLQWLCRMQCHITSSLILDASARALLHRLVSGGRDEEDSEHDLNQLTRSKPAAKARGRPSRRSLSRRSPRRTSPTA